MGKNVLFVEDDAAVAAQVRARLCEAGHSVTLASTLGAARAALRASMFDAAVLDVQLPDGSGLDLLPLGSSTPALVLTVLDDERTSYRALSRGASGYLVKPDGIASIARALDDLLAGGSPISPRIARWLLEDLRAREGVEPPPEDIEALTPREREVVELFAVGATYAEVARGLGISVNTVRQHVRALYDKLHVCSKTEAVLKVMPHAGRV